MHTTQHLLSSRGQEPHRNRVALTMTDAGIAQINKLSKDDIVIALMGITGSGFVRRVHTPSCLRDLLTAMLALGRAP